MDRSEWVLVPRAIVEQCQSHAWDSKYLAVTDTSRLLSDVLREFIAAAPPPPAEQASGEVADLLADLNEYLVGCPDPGKVPQWFITKPSRLLLRCRAALSAQHPTGVDSEATRPVVDEAGYTKPYVTFNRGKMTVDIRRFLATAAGRALIKKVIALAPQQPEKGEG